jgi:hypothetical protein
MLETILIRFVFSSIYPKAGMVSILSDLARVRGVVLAASMDGAAEGRKARPDWRCVQQNPGNER